MDVCVISANILIISVLLICFRKCSNKFKRFRPFQILFGGTFLSSVILFLPIYTKQFSGVFGSYWLEIILLSIHQTIRLFVVDADFEIIFALQSTTPPAIYRGYALLASILYVLAPILTCSFILSFFKGVSAYYHMFIHRRRDTYVFSELSEKSIALAESIYRSSRKNTFVFVQILQKYWSF